MTVNLAFGPSLRSATAAPGPETPPLVGKVSADVCVAGGGFAGLAAALRLAESGAKVVVLEAREVGFGTSGRNGCQGRGAGLQTEIALALADLDWAPRGGQRSGFGLNRRPGVVILELARAEVAEARIKRLYAMVEEGLSDLGDTLRERLATLKLDRDTAKAALARIDVAARLTGAVAPDLFKHFSAKMRENVTTGEVPLRKASIQLIVDRIEVDDAAIRIIGDKALLEQAIIGSGAGGRAGVRSFVRKWRTRHDSNV